MPHGDGGVAGAEPDDENHHLFDQMLNEEVIDFERGTIDSRIDHDYADHSLVIIISCRPELSKMTRDFGSGPGPHGVTCVKRG